jgi:hypothetical protein
MHNGEEGCQGRKEEGRKEAVVLQEGFYGVLVEAPHFLAFTGRFGAPSFCTATTLYNIS